MTLCRTAGMLAFLLLLMTAGAVEGQTDARSTGGRLAFDVATVRMNTSGDDRGFFLPQGRQFTATNARLRDLIRFAYRLQPFQLVGGPGWLESARVDIAGKAAFDPVPAPPGAPPGQMEQMVQALLADRFRLQVHTEPRELPIYALVLSRRDRQVGPRLRPASTDCAAVAKGPAGAAAPPMPTRPGGGPACGMMGGPGRFSAGGVTLAMLAAALSGVSGRQVVDRTGLSGAYDVDLEFAPDPLGAVGDVAPASDRPSLFTALEEQLGIRLEPTRGPVEVLAIDRLELPTPND